MAAQNPLSYDHAVLVVLWRLMARPREDVLSLLNGTGTEDERRVIEQACQVLDARIWENEMTVWREP